MKLETVLYSLDNSVATIQMNRPDALNALSLQLGKDLAVAIHQAISDGARVRAFHAWSLLDNFQWAEGFTERYGLIYTDFRSQKRTLKDSGLWYARVAASNRLDV